MADIQVPSLINLATKIFPEARQRLPQLQKASRQENISWSQILQECRIRIQDTQRSY